MSKFSLTKIEERLKKEKVSLEEQLTKFAKKDVRPRGDWDTRFPQINREAGDDPLEDEAKAREEYERLLPVEFSLEKRLKNVNLALEKIRKAQYGICEKCQRKIPQKRLLVHPEARFCIKCQNKTS